MSRTRLRVNPHSVVARKQKHENNMKTIQSKSHHLSSYEINKISLSLFSDKCHILEDIVNISAHGHKNIK